MGGTLAWRGSAAYLQGKGHVENDTPCQDRAAIQTFDNGVTIATLSDGAGSAVHAQHGAQLVVDLSAKMVAQQFDAFFSRNISEKRIAQWLVPGLQWELSELSKTGVPASDVNSNPLPCNVCDLACTLLLVAVNDQHYLTLHLGDGVIGVETTRMTGLRNQRPISLPSNGEFANETVFLTSPSANLSLKVSRGRLDTRFHSVTGFILMSDGPEASLYHKPNHTLASACGKLIEACRTIPQHEMEEELYAVLEEHVSKKTEDDCSIALLAR